MKSLVKNIKGLCCLGLPESVVSTLQGYVAGAESSSGETVTVAGPEAGPLPAAAAVVELTAGRPIRPADFLRQLSRAAQEPSLHMPDFALGEYMFSPQERTLSRDGLADGIVVTDREADMLIYLARQNGRAVPRDELLKNVWRYQDGVDTHTLETHIYRLRQKLGDGPALLLTAEDGYLLPASR